MKAMAGLLLSVLVAGAGSAADLRIAAAASLTLPLTEVSAAYEADTGIAVKLLFGASGGLARQIEHGLPVDLFLSANPDWMNHLEQGGLLAPGSRRNLFRNRLVVIDRADSQAAWTGPGDLGKAGRIAVGDPATVPAGQYAVQALAWAGLGDAVETSLLPALNVRAALALVSRGEAEAGIVYLTDARSDPAVRVAWQFPEEAHDPIVYPGAVLAGASDPAAAVRFLDWLAGPEGRVPFIRAGFDPAFTPAP